MPTVPSNSHEKENVSLPPPDATMTTTTTTTDKMSSGNNKKIPHKRRRSYSRLPSNIMLSQENIATEDEVKMTMEPELKKAKDSPAGTKSSPSSSSSSTSSVTPITIKTRSGRKTRSSKIHDTVLYTIRPMQLKDIATVYHLGNAIFTATEFPNMYRTWDDFSVVENYEGSKDLCFVAETSIDNATTTTIGFLLGETVTKATIGTRGYIQWVAILPQYRRMGIATELIQSFTKVAKEQLNISLLLADTPADNIPSIQLFNKAGLSYKTDHVYLTCQLDASQSNKKKHVNEEDKYVNFSYTTKKKNKNQQQPQRVTIRTMEIDDLYPIYEIGEQIFTKKSANLYNFWDESLVLQSYLSDPEFCLVATVSSSDKDEKDETSTTGSGNNKKKGSKQNNKKTKNKNAEHVNTTMTTTEGIKNEVVVGFAFGTTIEKPKSSWKYGYLVWLGCAPEYQGIGISYQLYTTMLELFSMEKVRMVMIDTQTNNAMALNFFRKVGFGHDEEHVYLCNDPMIIKEQEQEEKENVVEKKVGEKQTVALEKE